MTEEPLPRELQALLQTYREALPDVEPGRDFMPGLWGRIEGRRRITHRFGRLARRFVTAAAAMCLILSGLHWAPVGHSTNLPGTTYVDVLADTSGDDVDDEISGGEVL